MDTGSSELIDRFYKCMANADARGLAELYAPDALMIRFDGTSKGTEEIVAFLLKMRADDGAYTLEMIEEANLSGDVLMWDAMINTSGGLLQTTEVLVLNAAGKIRRHVPGVRGYWGK